MNQLVNITQHILAISDGKDIALNVVIEGLYDQLCQIANHQLNKLNPENITASELVHELYLKLSRCMQFNANNRQHFLAISATAMRQLVIDQLKAKSRDKRGGDLVATTLSDTKMPMLKNQLEILAVDKALAKLKNIEPKLSSTVECRYFAGYSEKETAEALGVNERTVRRYWSRAKRWLSMELAS
jgi:RNA polymerase sigma factor (TIGR02999 family)